MIKNMNQIKILLIFTIILSSCGSNYTAINNSAKEKAMTIDSTKQYGFNRDFLKKHITVI